MKQRTILLLIWSLACLVLLVPAKTALAQSLPADISIFARPASPSPGENFTIRADDPGSDTKSAYFRWRINGQTHPELSGYGKNDITLVAGDLGSFTNVGADITTSNGETKSGKILVPVSDLSLAWAADTYVPRWYKGKALATPKSMVRVAAVPEIFLNGQIVPPEKLIFSWLINSSEVLSGQGEDVFEFEADDYSAASHPIRVRVRDFQNTISKSASVVITSTNPRLMLYPFSPLGGIDPRISIKTALEKRGQIDLTLEPFFFIPESKRDLAYAWTVGGFSVPGQPENPFFLTIDTSNYSTKSINISVVVEQVEKVYKYITQSFTLNFE